MKRTVPVLASLLIAAIFGAAVAQAGLNDQLILEVKTRSKQPVRDLRIKVKCPDEPCVVAVNGAAKAGDEKFDLKPKERSLEDGEGSRMRLRFENARQLKNLLEDENGRARIRVRGTDDAGVVAKTKLTVKLVR